MGSLHSKEQDVMEFSVDMLESCDLELYQNKIEKCVKYVNCVLSFTCDKNSGEIGFDLLPQINEIFKLKTENVGKQEIIISDINIGHIMSNVSVEFDLIFENLFFNYPISLIKEIGYKNKPQSRQTAKDGLNFKSKMERHSIDHKIKINVPAQENRKYDKLIYHIETDEGFNKLWAGKTVDKLQKNFMNKIPRINTHMNQNQNQNHNHNQNQNVKTSVNNNKLHSPLILLENEEELKESNVSMVDDDDDDDVDIDTSETVQLNSDKDIKLTTSSHEVYLGESEEYGEYVKRVYINSADILSYLLVRTKGFNQDLLTCDYVSSKKYLGLPETLKNAFMAKINDEILSKLRYCCNDMATVDIEIDNQESLFDEIKKASKNGKLNSKNCTIFFKINFYRIYIKDYDNFY